MLILAMDPSGSYNEGKGTTGYSVWVYNNLDYKLIQFGQLAATEYNTKEEYWQSHIELIKQIEPDILVIEDYLLYAHKAAQQIGSKMETPKLIGIIEYECAKLNIKIVMQKAVDVKNRWNDDILIWKGIIYKNNKHYYINNTNISRHIRDSIRHGIHYIMKLKKKELKAHDR